MTQNEIPSEWEFSFLSDIVEIIRGVTYKKAQSSTNPDKGLLPVLRANNIQKGKLLNSDLVYVPCELVKQRQKLNLGDIVVAMSSGSKSVVGKAAKVDSVIDGSFGAFCGVLRPVSGVDSNYVSWFTHSLEYRNKVSSLSAGANINNLKPSHFDVIAIPVAPLAEQKAIAEKLDTLLAQVERTKARLERIPKILKRFRQSVLAAAVSGKLTEEWCNNNGVVTCWDEVKLADYVYSIEAGKNLKCTEIPPSENEYGIIKISAVTWGVYNEEESKTLPSRDLFNENRRIKVGDLLISRANTIELLGNPVIVRKVSKNLMLSDKVLRLVMDDDDKSWVDIYLKSPRGRKEIQSRATGNQQSMRNIGQKALLDIDIPKLADEEKSEIVRRVDQLFAYADTIETQVNNALERVNNLTQSILAKAFRGELTEQWRKDNPDLISGENSAEALLEKIKAERAASKPVKRGRRKA